VYVLMNKCINSKTNALTSDAELSSPSSLLLSIVMTSFFLFPLPEELLLVLRLVVVVACVCCFLFVLLVRLAGIKGKC